MLFQDTWLKTMQKAFFATQKYSFPMTFPKTIITLQIWNKTADLCALSSAVFALFAKRLSCNNSVQQLAKPSPGMATVGFLSGFCYVLLCVNYSPAYTYE